MLRTKLIIVAGLAADIAHQVADLAARRPPAALVHHDLRALSEGVVRRTVRTPRGAVTETVLELAHGCASCTLREDVLPLLHSLAAEGVERIVLHLDPALEPEPVCWALSEVALTDGSTVSDVLDVEAVLTAVDGASWLGQATSAEPLTEFGVAGGVDDERTIAQVAVAGVTFADALILRGTADPATLAALDRLAPTAAVSTADLLDIDALLAAIPCTARRGVPDDPHGPLLHGQPPLHTEHGVVLTEFAARRPFHPQRLHHAVDELLAGVVASWGRIWLASQPEKALWLESAGGGMRVGDIGPWLCGQPDSAWQAADPQRRAMAGLRWHPDCGDREQHLMILARDEAAPERIRHALAGALLTDGELAEGSSAWRRLSDPFGNWQEEPSVQGEQR